MESSAIGSCNQVSLLLAGFGYQTMHVQRALQERVTGTGWRLRRLAERVLRTRNACSGPRNLPSEVVRAPSDPYYYTLDPEGS